MSKYYVFNQTVQGYLHIVKNTPCEDSSFSFSDDNDCFYIAVVADGHGSSSCFRSKSGSAFAADIAFRNLKKFAEYYISKNNDEQVEETDSLHDLFISERTKKQLLKRLTNSIISEWHQRVMEDIDNNPITKDEIDSSEEEYVDLYQRGLKLDHIYGTTLIAVLLMENYAIMLQQGDGRCDVLYADGTVDQPIPWDDRCFDVFTTSMCDDDVDTSFRTTVIDLSEKPIAACFLGCDGVEDSFRTMDGTHDFYMQLSTHIIDDQEHFSEYLCDYLPEFSKNGSGDDVSVAGIVDIEKVEKLYNTYKNKIEAYRLSETKFQKQFKIDSMTRKHTILKSRLEKARQELTLKTGEWIEANKQYRELSIKVDNLQRQIESEKMTQSEGIEKIKEVSLLSGVVAIIEKQFPSAFSIISDTLKNTGTNDSDSAISAYEETKLSLNSYKNKLNSLSEELQKVSENYNSLFSEYEEYNRRYEILQSELNTLDLEIKKLQSL